MIINFSNFSQPYLLIWDRTIINFEQGRHNFSKTEGAAQKVGGGTLKII